MSAPKLKNTVLREVAPGRRAKLADGRLLRVSARCQEDVWAREILERDAEWMTGKYGDRESEIFIAPGGAQVVEVYQ